MDRVEAIEALIPNVRLQILTCDVTNYKKKYKSLTKCGKTKIKLYLHPLP